jgi:hypothetical protein
MTLIVRPGFQFDTDASTYIEAVEAADTQALETATRYAINDFVIGCKQDGIWTAIKASCILAGARTLTGALVPLVGTAPTNVGPFVSGDYNRKTGLVGDGSTKYLNSNRNNNADPQNSKHVSVFVSTLSAQATQYFVTRGVFSTAGNTLVAYDAGLYLGRINVAANAAGSIIQSIATTSTGFIGVARTSSSSQALRFSKSVVSNSGLSVSPASGSLELYRLSNGTGYTSCRLAFYSIGESLDLALLDARVSALITAFGVAIP